MILETLYKRTRTGAIQYWKIETRGALLDAQIRKESGQLGTNKPIVHVEPIANGKQKRSAIEQAEFQANSDWKKKHDEGYKSLTDLNIRSFVDEKIAPGTIYEEQFGLKSQTNMLDSILERNLPKFNTDASGNVKPMLAKEVNWDKVVYPCFVQPKLDGVRCLMVVSNGDIKFLSRSGKEYTTLQHIANDIDQAVTNGLSVDPFILDGEIYSDELTFQEITQAVKKQYPNSLKLKFRAYDIVSQDNQEFRIEEVSSLVDDIASEHVVKVDTYLVPTKERVKALHDEFVGNGYEGAMIRLPQGTYDQGQRSSSLLKVKEFDETEFAFLRFEFGQRGVQDLMAVCITDTGAEFRPPMNGSLKWKEQLYADMDNLEGKSLTVRHFGYTDDNIPRFPKGKAFRNYE